MENESPDHASLQAFYDEGFITDVLNTIKSGKEATIYLCEAHPRIGAEFLAAKVYRTPQFRAFRNDAVYREGRVIRDRRVGRAVRAKTGLGRQAQFGMWVGQEFETMACLYEVGADIPKPVAIAGKAILMEYLGDEQEAAPMLNRVRLAPSEAPVLFERLLANVQLFLACNVVHADLSAFNVLYWQGAVKVIDFPQAVDARFNPNADALLERDIHNLCRHFARYGIEADASALADDLWRRFLRAEL